MTARPILRDDLLEGGRAVFASRQRFQARPASEARATHSYAALGFYTSGTSRVEQAGEWSVRVGDVLLIPAGQPHGLIEADRPEAWGLGFCAPCFAADGAATLLEPFERVRDGGAAVVHIPGPRQSFLESLFRELEAASEPQFVSASREAVQRSLLTLILDEVRRAGDWDVPTPGPSSVVSDSLRFIERNCLRKLTLLDVAAAVGRSPAYVTTALSRATGRSAVEWIIAGRMAEARRLLLHSDEMVDCVSERVGYADPTHFIRMFRREHGATPAAWRALKASNQ